MRVALLSFNAQVHNAVGNHIAEKVRFFQERGAEVRLFVQDAKRLHPELRSCTRELAEATLEGPAWDFLQQADLVFAIYAQAYDLLQFLPRLSGTGPRLVFDYLGVTPPEFWKGPHREGLERTVRERGYVWCADHALTISHANRRELLEATNFSEDKVTTLALAVDTERFQPGPRDRFLHKKLGINGRIVLYVGRFAANKRVSLLIEALARVENRSVHAVLVGDCSDVYAEEATRCLTLAHQLGVHDRVHLIGQLNEGDLAKAYRSADVLAIPSLHEGFCVPVVEAMASGCPVIVARTTALPETIGAAGLTFVPNDADDLARQIRRVLNESNTTPARPERRRVAIVSFRFGTEIVGGAETSLRTMAHALQDGAHIVEVFTTCTRSESNWKNDVPPGTATIDGVTVHRFPVDPHDHAAHGEIVRAINEAGGGVPVALEARYLQHSIHATALLQALRERQHEFDAIITGPYLFGLSADVATEFSSKTLVVPCFHNEPIARLKAWPQMFGQAGGLLFHSSEEQNLAQTELGVNHPNAAVMGTFLSNSQNDAVPVLPRALTQPYLVYCGRYSEQKNVPLLLEWARRYRERERGPLEFVFIGRGDLTLPSAPWLHDLGHVDESTKRAVLAKACALVQLSCQESLSLVALEAWAEGTPVIVHQDCTVLASQIERSHGGAAIADFEQFADVLNDLVQDTAGWRERGANGRAYVAAHYSTRADYVNRIVCTIDAMARPVAELMRKRGVERARDCARERWQERFANFVESVLSQPARRRHDDVRIEPLRTSARAAGMRTLLLPVRFINHGTHAAVSKGPGRTVVCCEIRAAATDAVVVPCVETTLPSLVMPNQTQVAALPIEVPAEDGAYRICLWTERTSTSAPIGHVAEVALTVERDHETAAETCVSTFLDTVARTLPMAHHLQQLPAEYVDVTEGALAPVKRFIKRKMLHNFKNAYVDVMSRQQSQLNGHMVLMIQQLAECCAMLDQAVAGLYDQQGSGVDSDAPVEYADRRPHG